MDQVIFEEFKGTGNSELVLSRELAERRIFPAIDLVASATRREELLLDPETLEASRALRQRIAGMTPINAMNDLLVDLRRHPTNEELVRGLSSEAAAAPPRADRRSPTTASPPPGRTPTTQHRNPGGRGDRGSRR
jgi:transcription termination factor Rho